MAFNTTRDKATVITINLGALVEQSLSTIVKVRNRERASAEAKFQQTVIDQGLSYEAQMEYRKGQIEAEQNKENPDTEYIDQLKVDLAGVRKLKRFSDIRENYLASYEDLKAGKINLQQHADFLTSQLSSTQDEDARKEIRQELSAVRVEISNSEISILNNRILLAQKDGTVSALQDAIDKVGVRKSYADLNGNTEESSMWDVSLTSLRKQLNEANVVNTMHDFELQLARSGMSAMQKLDKLNSQLSTADDKTPITIQGTTYKSAKEFWTLTRDNYINGVGSQDFSNFFSDLETEVKSKIDTVASVSKFNFVPTETLDRIQGDYVALSSKAEFQPVLNKLQASRTSALAYGVDKSAQALITSSVESLQVGAGQETLANLEQRYGIDLSARKAELNQAIISKGASLPSIDEAMKNLKKQGAEVPAGETPSSLEPKNVFTQPEQKDLSGTYKRNKATGQIINKTTNQPVPNEQAFFQETGLKSFSGVKFEEFEETPPGGTPSVTPAGAPAPAKFSKSAKGFNSIVDFLSSEGKDTTFNARKKLFAESGLGSEAEYRGTANQNVALLQKFY